MGSKKGFIPFEGDQFIKIRIPLHSPEWYKFRTTGLEIPGMGFYGGGIGASEAAKLIIDENTGLPINPYEPSPAQLYEQKIGREKINHFSNEAILWGIVDEPKVLDMWRFWDGTPGGYVDHHLNWRKAPRHRRADYVQREYGLAHYYLVNKNYPQLFVSLDAFIMPGSPNMITGEMLSAPAPLEAKTIGEYTAREYESGVPAQYVIQLHQQMMVTESDYGEIVLKKSGQTMDVRYFERNEDLCNLIDDVTKRFWFSRVIPARKSLVSAINHKHRGNGAKYTEMMQKVESLQPGPDASDAYRKWATDRFVRNRSYVKGDDDQYELLRRYSLVSEYMKSLKNEKDQMYNKMIKECADLQTGEIIFSDKSYIRMGKTKTGNRIYAGYKPVFDKVGLRKETESLSRGIKGVLKSSEGDED